MQSEKLKRILLYYPVRYYICAFLVAFVLMSNVHYIKTIDNIALVNMLNFFSVPAELSPNSQRLIVQEEEGPTNVIMPII